MVKVLFVCLGNICRSPTAHGVFQKKVADNNWSSRITIDSAGTAGWHEGKSPDPRSISAAAENGYDLASLRARQVIVEDFDSYDYILAMDSNNLDDLKAICPSDFSGELTLFRSYSEQALKDVHDDSSENGLEVPDPYYGSEDGFTQVIRMVEQASDGLLAYIINKHFSDIESP